MKETVALVLVALYLLVGLAWFAQARSDNIRYNEHHSLASDLLVIPGWLVYVVLAGLDYAVCWWGMRQAARERQ